MSYWIKRAAGGMGALSCCMRPSTATEPGNDDVLPGSSSTPWIRNMALDMEYWPLPGTPAFVQMGRGDTEDAAIRPGDPSL